MFKNKKNILFVTMIVMLLGLVSYFYIEHNIHQYSVYYAKHMPYGEDRDLMIMEFVDNLEIQNYPIGDKLEFDLNDKKTVKINFKYSKNNTPLLNSQTQSRRDKYIYMSDDNFYYKFDYLFTLTYASDVNYEEKKLSQSEEQNLKTEIYNFIKPALDNHHVPKVNLQWIYNLINQDRINYMTNKINE